MALVFSLYFSHALLSLQGTRITERADCTISSSPHAVAATYESERGSLIPWLKGMGSNRLATQRALPPLQINTGGRCSTPHTPPLTPATGRPPLSASWSFQSTGHSDRESGLSVQGVDACFNAAVDVSNSMVAENVRISSSIHGDENMGAFSFIPLNLIDEGFTSTMAWDHVRTEYLRADAIAEQGMVSSRINAWEGQKGHHLQPELELTLGYSYTPKSSRETSPSSI